MTHLDQGVIDKIENLRDFTVQFGTKKSFGQRTTTYFLRFICNKSKDVETEYVTDDEFTGYIKVYKKAHK
jgi:hypothetical protein